MTYGRFSKLIFVVVSACLPAGSRTTVFLLNESSLRQISRFDFRQKSGGQVAQRDIFLSHNLFLELPYNNKKPVNLRSPESAKSDDQRRASPPKAGKCGIRFHNLFRNANPIGEYWIENPAMNWFRFPMLANIPGENPHRLITPG